MIKIHNLFSIVYHTQSQCAGSQHLHGIAESQQPLACVLKTLEGQREGDPPIGSGPAVSISVANASPK